MKNALPVRLLTASLLALVPAACATSASHQAERTVSTTESLSAQVTQLSTDLEAMGAAIGQLRESVGAKGLFNRETVAKGDVEAAYASYKKALDDVQSSAKKVSSSDKKLASSMSSYLASWEKSMAEVQNEQLRESSMKRRDEAKKNFDQVAERVQNRWKAFEEYLANLEEIEIALGTDLTPAGIDAIDGTLGKAQDRCNEIRQGLGELTKPLTDFAAALRAGAPPPETTDGGK